MKFATIVLAVVFNLSLLLMYSRGLVGGDAGEKAAEEKAGAARKRVEERSASIPYEKSPPPNAQAPKSAAASRTDTHDSKEVAEPAKSADSKEVIDPKDSKDVAEPVAENVQAWKLRSGQGQPSTELFPRGGEIRGQQRGILAPANPANVDPPVVSPEAR
jgi:hypothetical protein